MPQLCWYILESGRTPSSRDSFHFLQRPMRRLTPSLRFAAIMFVAALLTPGSSAAQNDSAGEASTLQQQIQAAMGKVSRGDAEGGIADLRILTDEHPESAPAWDALGRAHQAGQDHSAALEAFEQAVELAPDNGQIQFNLGTSYALNGQVDAAFDALARADASGTVDITRIDAGPAAATLRDDPRYAELMPTNEEYADPFVEDARILREWVGEGRAEVFGWIARNIGDVDGDGIADVATSSKGVIDTGTRDGKVYVYSTGSGELLWSYKGTVSGGQLGFGIEAAGDVNADGIPDVVAGAPHAGYVKVFHGRTGEILLELESDDPTSGFGISVKGIGDLNGDDHSDIIVGEPYQLWGNPINGGTLDHPGAATIFSGADGSVILRLAGEQPGDGFGSNVAGRTVDGETWFMVGAPNAADDSHGRSYVYRGYTSTPHFVAEADDGGADFGQMFQSVLGDVDGDGVPDVYISDWVDNSTAQRAGKIYVLSGADGSEIFTRTGEAAGDGFGIGISNAGDVNGDGHADIITAAWQHAGGAPSGGKLYLISGADGSTMRTITGDVPGETLGFDTTNVGDVDGDGATDFLVTSAYSAINGWHAGRVLVIAGE